MSKQPLTLALAALAFAKRGWYVFACHPKSKRPLTKNGYKDATNDVETVRKMWEQYPDANIGLVPGLSGFVVIDVDGPVGEESLRRLGLDTVKTLFVKTGRGRHLYFAHPGGRIGNAHNLGDGLDIRCDAGYVLAPPSVHPTGAKYQWGGRDDANNVAMFPAPIIARLGKKRDRQTVTATNEFSLYSVPEGGRNNALMSHLGRLRQRGATEAELLEAAFKYNQEEFDPPLDASEVQQVAHNAAQYAVGVQSSDDAVDELNKRHAIITIGGRVSVLMQKGDTFELMRVADLRTLYANRVCAAPDGKIKSIAEAWLKHPRRRQYSGIVFEPGGTTTEGAWNLWPGWGVMPTPGDCSLFLEHIHENICTGNEEYARWVLAWIADMFQRPCQKPGTALVFRGSQGTGKTIVGKIIGKLLGRCYVLVASPHLIVGHFNAHLVIVLMLQADEGFWAGDHTAEGVLKDMVTNQTIWIERKGIDAIEFPNYLRLLVTSNNEWVVPAGPMERRFCVMDVSERRMQQSSYFEKLMEQMEHGGYEALLHHLLTLDYSDVDLRQIPRTAALFEQQVSSLRPEEGWWYDVLSRGALPGDFEGYGLVRRSLLYTHYLHSLNRLGVRRRSLETQVGRFLNKYVPGVRREDQKVGPDPQAKAQGIYRFPSLKECRKAFAKRLGFEIPWDNPEAAWQPDTGHSDYTNGAFE
jgi:hypothetical protein